LVPLTAHLLAELPENMRILVVEDEIKAAEYLQQGLIECGYLVDCVSDGLDGFHLALQNDYDIVLLDVNLPTMDGWEVLELIRRRKQTRVIMLTANGRLEQKVRGLESGADDYLVKPFQFPELLARIRTLLRRGEAVTLPSNLRVADLELDPARHRAYRSGQRIDLTSKEFALLHLLMRRTGEVLTRTEITAMVWDINFDCDTNVVDVAIRRLRMKVDEPFGDRLIHTDCTELLGTGAPTGTARPGGSDGQALSDRSWTPRRHQSPYGPLLATRIERYRTRP